MRVEAEEAIIDPVTFFQKLHDIEAIIHAAGYIRENGSDFDRQEEHLKESMEQTKVLLEEMDRKLAYAESISKCFDVLDRFGPDVQGEGNKLCRNARAILKSDGINPDGEEQSHFCSELQRMQDNADTFRQTYRSAQVQLNRLHEVKIVAERVREDAPVIVEKKGRQKHEL